MIRFLACVLAGFLIFASRANADPLACSIMQQSALLALFSDNAAAGSILPLDVRDLICSAMNTVSFDARQWNLAAGSASDQAPALQQAVNYVSSIGGGVVTVPAGIYTLKSQLVGKPRVRIQCNANAMGSGSAGVTTVSGGTLFSVQWGSGSGSSANVADAAVVLNYGATLDGCGFTYPGQSYSASSPIEYGATIAAYDATNGDIGQTATNNFCFNCYSFLDFRGSLVSGGAGIANAKVEGNWGAPVAYGLRINNQADWGNWDHNIFHTCGFNIGGSLTSGLCNWTINNGVAFEVGPSDWLNIDHEQEWGYPYGVFYTVSGGSTYASTGPLHVRDSQFDGCLGYCVGINPSASVNLEEVDVTNNRFTPFNPATGVASATTGGIALYANANFSGQLSFQNNFMFGPMNYMVYTSNFTDATIVNNRYSSATGVSANAEPLVTLGSGTTLIFEGNVAHGWPGTLDSLGTITNTPFTPSSYNFLN